MHWCKEFTLFIRCCRCFRKIDADQVLWRQGWTSWAGTWIAVDHKNLQISTADTGLWIDQCVEPVKEAETRRAVDWGISEPSKSSVSVHATFKLLSPLYLAVRQNFSKHGCLQSQQIPSSFLPRRTQELPVYWAALICSFVGVTVWLWCIWSPNRYK